MKKTKKTKNKSNIEFKGFIFSFYQVAGVAGGGGEGGGREWRSQDGILNLGGGGRESRWYTEFWGGGGFGGGAGEGVKMVYWIFFVGEGVKMVYWISIDYNLN